MLQIKTKELTAQMEQFTLEKPDVIGSIEKVLAKVPHMSSLFQYVEKATSDEYLYWDKLKYKPRPKGVSAEEFWALIKLLRQNSLNRAKSVVRDEQGREFSWQPLPGQDYLLHLIDLDLGGALMADIIESEAARQRFITRGIIEEAIASSQLEGANTTRRVAKRMLLEKRAPANKSERMILNNYRAMLVVENELRQRPLSEQVLKDLHVTLTEDTIPGDMIGRFRTDKDEIVVCDAANNVIYHVPPSEKFIKKEIKRFVQYANDSSEEHKFVHPVIKAIILPLLDRLFAPVC